MVFLAVVVFPDPKRFSMGAGGAGKDWRTRLTESLGHGAHASNSDEKSQQQQQQQQGNGSKYGAADEMTEEEKKERGTGVDVVANNV